MGLLKNITEGVYETPSVIDKKLSNGLLDSVSHLNLTSSLTHIELIKKYSINYFCKLEANDRYFITNSINFDPKSILLSYSTVDFWNGISPIENKLYSFSITDNSILSLFQLFSFELKDQIKHILVLRQNNCVFLCCFNNLFSGNTSALQKDLSRVSFETTISNSISNDNYKLLKININSVLNSTLENNIRNKFYLKKLFSNALYNEILNRFLLYFSLVNIQETNIFEVGVPQNISTDLIIKHLNFNFSDFIESDNIVFEL